MLISVCPTLSHYMDRVEQNKSNWTNLFEDYDKKMKAGNGYFLSELELRNLPGSAL